MHVLMNSGLFTFVKYATNLNLARCVRVFCIGLLALALVACNGSRGILSGLEIPSQKTIQLALQVGETSFDGKMSVALQARSMQSIFQLSTRIHFDPLALKPVKIERGGLVGQQAVFFALDNQPGFIPLAFTYHQGDSLPPGIGTIAQFEFEVLDASRPAKLRFSVNEDYLIARDERGNNVPVQLVVVE